MASDFSALIPVEMGRQILQEAAESSIALRLGSVQRMTTSQTSIPVLSALPTARFLAGVGAVKPATEISWTSERIIAEEVAATIPVPRSYLDDSAFNIWGEIRPRLGEAVAKAVDDAIISGVGAPATFPPGGVIALGNPVIQAEASPDQPDLAQAISYAMSRIENTGLTVTGFGARTSVRGHFRALRSGTGEWLVWAPQQPGAPTTMYGEPLYYSKLGFTPATAADLIAGAWDYLVIGLREDMRFDMSEDAVLTDPVTRTITVSAFEQDMVIMRVYMRLGCAVGRPVANRPDGTQGLGTPFANVKVPTGPANAAAEPETASAAKAGK